MIHALDYDVAGYEHCAAKRRSKQLSMTFVRDEFLDKRTAEDV